MLNIVLIDDVQDVLTEWTTVLTALKGDRELEIRQWLPKDDGETAEDGFDKLVDPDTVLVITDYDLSKGGQNGLRGSAIMNWCNRRLLPVADYSRDNKARLPKEPDQYELRADSNAEKSAPFMLNLFDGFVSLRKSIADDWENLSKKNSPAAILAAVLGRPLEESRFALYGVKIGSTNLFETLEEAKDKENEKQRFMTYLLGHLLFNVIMRFPGPIVDCHALAAFLGVNVSETDRLAETFQPAKYDGPFGNKSPYYWLSDVEEVLEGFPDIEEMEGSPSIGRLNRLALETKFGQLAKHDCPNRCHGEEGGFICAFTKKTVCLRTDCSVASNTWIPQGARLCRIEKEYYNEWAPMLGF